MRIVPWSEALPGAAMATVPAAATIGVFDGLHLGHRELVARVVAKAPGYIPMAVTFRDNPKKLTRPHQFEGDLFSLEQKLSSLDAAGIQLCVLIDFSGNFSKLAGSEFVSTLVRSFGVRSFVVGSDFKCGHRLSTDARSLGELARSNGATAEIVEPVAIEGEAVSSSRIRSAVASGRMDQALAMLGRPYTLDLRRFETEYDGTTLIVSLRGHGVVEPAPGTYSVTVICPSGCRDVEATIRHDGSLRWAADGCTSDVEPSFLAFGPKIA